MKKKRLMMIGVDSLDPHLTRKFLDELPNLRCIAREGMILDSESVFPPDSIPAWISIFTGMLPSSHGIIHSFDVFQSDWKNILAINPESFKDRIFWNILSESGHKVCVLFPQLCFPPWVVDGVMVSRSLNLEILSTPRGATSESERKSLAGLTGVFPGKKGLGKFFEEALCLTKNEGNLAQRLSREFDWEFFFVFLAWLDIVSHFFWRYMDTSDPRFPGPNPFQNYIKMFYIEVDRVIGGLRALHPESDIMVVSDHGHGMRPPRTVNINAVLREKGFLVENRSLIQWRPRVQEFMKRALLDVVLNLELDEWMLKISTKNLFAEASKNVYMSKSLLSEASVARLSSFAGPKSYPWGGIDVAKDSMSKAEYEHVRSGIINAFLGLKNPVSGMSLVKWARRREDMFSGDHVELYPDVLFELQDQYGVYWSTRGPLIGRSYEHNLSSGGHKRYGLLVCSDIKGLSAHSINPRIIDLCPTVLDYFCVASQHKMDGISLIRN